MTTDKEELRKIFRLKFTYEAGDGTRFNANNKESDLVFDWFYSKLEAKDKECAAKIAAGERLRMEDAMSAINEANGLREKIKDQELIIYGIEEGSKQWESLCADKDNQIADLKAKLEAAKTALGNIRGELYSRDDSTSVHRAMSKILEDNGFPWEPED